jgi:serine/threonine protein kinase
MTTREASPYACDECGVLLDAEAATCSSCAAVRPRRGWSLHPFLGRTLLGRYRICTLLGRGASSEVFLATDTTLPPDAGTVVVKVLSGAFTDSARKRFLNEVRAVRRLTGAHCIKVYDAGIDGNVPCIVMERLEGQTLRAWMALSAPPAGVEIRRIALEIASALQEAHDKGIVHRDVKPDNVFLCGTERFVKVLDFGAASLLGADATHSSVGTPRYMAPEQVQMRPIDGRSDLYALGVVLYELSCGAPPFVGDVAQVLLQHVHTAPSKTHLEMHLRDVRAVALILSLLEKTPAKRPTSALELREQLARCTFERVTASGSAATTTVQTSTRFTPAAGDLPQAEFAASAFFRTTGAGGMRARTVLRWLALALVGVVCFAIQQSLRQRVVPNVKSPPTTSPLSAQPQSNLSTTSSADTDLLLSPEPPAELHKPLTYAHTTRVLPSSAYLVPLPYAPPTAPRSASVTSPTRLEQTPIPAPTHRSGELKRDEF